MRTIELNSLQLNAVRLNGIGEYQRGSHAGAPPVVPDIPDIPEEPDVPSDPEVDENGYIIFEDAEVARICAENWGDGTGITLEQAAAVTKIAAEFTKNAEIEAFDELEKFANVTYIDAAKSNNDYRGFINCASLKRLTLPRGVKINDGTWVNIKGGAFVGSAIESVGNLEEASYIGDYAFCNVSTLSFDGIFRNNDVAKVGKESFFGCANFAAALVLPSLTTLGNYAFCKSGITKVLDLGIVNTIFGAWAAEGRMGDFSNCPNLELAILPDTVTSIKDYAFFRSAKLRNVIVKASTPPALENKDAFNGVDSNFIIYVPDASVAAYREASVWSSYASRIFPISQLSTDNPDLYNEIKEYL